MRKVVVVGILFMLFLLACSSGLEKELSEDETVRLFYAMHAGEINATAAEYSGQELLAELARTECPQVEGKGFVRGAFKGRYASLIAYTVDEKVECMLLKPKGQPDIVRGANGSPGTALGVNGEEITEIEVRNAIARLPAGTRLDNATTGAVLNDMINQALLRQEAAKFQIPEEEMLEAHSQFIDNLGIAEEDFPGWLAAQNLTDDDVRNSLREQLQMRKLLQERLLLDELSVDEQSAREFYLANTNQFLQSEQAVMRHIFLSSEQHSEQELEDLTRAISRQIASGDFCELVSAYSDDAERKEQCGVYVVPRGVINSDLEYAAFNTLQNQTALVQTAQGIHFVQTLQVVPPQVVPYSQVAGELATLLRTSAVQQRLNLYVQLLRSDAEIVFY